MERARTGHRKPGASPDTDLATPPAPGKRTRVPALAPAAAARDADYERLTAQGAAPDAIQLHASGSAASTATAHAPDHDVMVARVTAALEHQQDELEGLVAARQLGRRELDAVGAELDQTRAELARVKAGPIDPGALQDIIQRHRLVVGHAMRKTDGTSKDDRDEITLRGGTLAREVRSKTVVHGAAGDATTSDASRLSISASGVVAYSSTHGVAKQPVGGDDTTRTTSVVADLHGGTVTGKTEGERIARDQDGNTVKTSQDVSVSMGAKGGKLRVGIARGEGVEITPKGTDKATGGESHRSEHGVGLLGGKGGVGAGYDAARESSRIGPSGRVETRKHEGAIGVTTGGVKGRLGRTSTTKGELGELERKVSADGGLTCDVARQDDGTYLVTITLHAGLGGAITGKTGKKAGGSSDELGASAGGKLGAELRWTKVLDEDHAAALLSEVEQADGTRTKYVGLLARIRALGMHGGDAATSVVALFDGAAGVDELAVGETIAVELSGELSAGANVAIGTSGVVGVGASIAASAGGKRTLAITRVDPAECGGRRCVDLTVGFGGNASLEAEASLTAGHAGLASSAKQAGAMTDAVTVRLDADAPDYAQRYARVVRGTPDELRALARAQQVRVEATTGRTDKLSVGPIGLAVSDAAQRASEQEVEDGRVTVTEQGGRTQGGALSIGDTKVLQGSAESTASYTADRGGSTLALEAKRDESDLGRTLAAIPSGIADRIRAVFGGTDKDGTRLGGDQRVEKAIDAVTQSPGERVKAQLETTYSRLERYHLGPVEIGILVDRAGDRDKWMHCATSARLYATWDALREVLLSPRPALEVDGVDLDQAREITRGQVIAMFVEEFGSAGLQCLIGVLRRYGMTIANAPREAAAGVHEEWPERLARVRPVYEEAQADVELADEEFAKRARRTDKATALPRYHDAVKAKLAGVRAAIAACEEFRDPSARLEMLDHVDRLANELDAAWRRNAHLASDRTRPSRDLGALLEPDPVAASDAQRVGQLTALLHDYKAAERDLFERVRELLPVRSGGTNDGWFAAGNGKAARELLESPRTSQLYTSWVAKVRELRATYARLGTPSASWEISQAGGARTELEPAIAQRIALYLAAERLAPNMNASGLVEIWKAQAGY